MAKQFIVNEINKSRMLLDQIVADQHLLKTIEQIAESAVAVLNQGNKILFAGNGGSAADSQHLAAELVSRLRYNRPALPSVALTTDTSALTAIGNDYSFEYLFARQVEALGQKGDMFIGISTSGKSPNILKALEAARAKGIVTVGFTGKTSPLMAAHCDWILNIPATETAKIQECHILVGHIVCSLIEEAIFGAEYNPARKTQAMAS